MNQTRLPLRRTVYFASGSNHPGEIRGFADIGHPVGVAANHVRDAAEAELLALAGTDLPVFVDSGAFSEVDFDDDGRPIVKPGMEITLRDWNKRLGLYQRLARKLRHQLWAVAPDRVGDQDYTLKLLKQFRSTCSVVSHHGGELLVPLQRGALDQAAMHDRVDAILRCRWTPAIPCKHAATPVKEIARYAAARQPRRIHLLGMGPTNRRCQPTMDAIWAASPRTEIILHDSFMIRAHVGRTNGRGGGPRKYTAACDAVRRQLDTEGLTRGTTEYTYEVKRRAIHIAFSDRANRRSAA